MEVVLDSNVLISVLNRNDSSHTDATELIALLEKEEYEILAPALFLWEFVSYSYHTEKSKNHQQNTSAKFHVTTIDVTTELFWRTHSETMTSVSGADRVFVSIAKDNDAPLITNDARVLKYADALGIRALSVQSFLAEGSNNSFKPKPLRGSA